jgi:hypothetical protein
MELLLSSDHGEFVYLPNGSPFVHLDEPVLREFLMNFNFFSSQLSFNNIDIFNSLAISFKNGTPFDQCPGFAVHSLCNRDLPSFAISTLKGFFGTIKNQ